MPDIGFCISLVHFRPTKSFDSYPEIGVISVPWHLFRYQPRAREKRDAARELIEFNPSAHRKIEKAKRGADTFEGVAREWLRNFPVPGRHLMPRE